MDPLTTLLAAAAATGPNILQSQALTALRSAGPQESFFTRMGNPHPLQVQRLGQPTTQPDHRLRRDERPQPVSFTVTDAAQLSRALSEMGSGSGIPESTYSELAAILLRSGNRGQAIDISSEVMCVADGVHQILFIPWAGRERTTFSMEEARRGPTTNTLGLTAHLPAAYWASYPKTECSRSRGQRRCRPRRSMGALPRVHGPAIAYRPCLPKQSNVPKPTPTGW